MGAVYQRTAFYGRDQIPPNGKKCVFCCVCVCVREIPWYTQGCTEELLDVTGAAESTEHDLEESRQTER